MNKIKVLFLYDHSFYGPVMIVYGHIIDHLDRSRFAPYVIANSEAEKTASLPVASRSDTHIQHLEFGHGFAGSPLQRVCSSSSIARVVPRLLSFVKRESIDVIQTSSVIRTSMLGLAVARLGGARLLLHYHNPTNPRSSARRLLEASVARLADRCVAVSSWVASEIVSLGVSERKVEVVLNGANLKRFNPSIDGSAIRREFDIAPDAPLVLQLARLTPYKRQEDLIRAFAIARQRVPQLRCLLVGWEQPGASDGFPTYRAKLQYLHKELGLDDSLIIAPARPEAPQLMAAADIVAMPSVEEPFGLVVAEAMAAGKPVIGAASGGIPEIVSDGVTGFLVPPRSPEDLADKLVRLATNANLRARMGSAARQRAEGHFDENRLAGEFGPIYEAMVAPGHVN